MNENKELVSFLEPFERLRAQIEFFEQNHGIIDSNAMTLATATKEGRPSARMVLLKGLDEKGLVFYTNMESRKGREIAENPYASLLFYWRKPGRQVRIEGQLEYVSDSEADDYFYSRPQGSRIGAWASKQSQKMESRYSLEKEVAKWSAKFLSQKIERPPHWTGCRLVAESFEFWQAGKFRLHKRECYHKTKEGWALSYLYP